MSENTNYDSRTNQARGIKIGFVLLGVSLLVITRWLLRSDSTATRGKGKIDQELDTSLEETFPASDPVGHY